MYHLGRRRAFSVEGDSMLPTLRHGDRVLVDPRAEVAVGDIITANHPFKTSVRLIKRVASIDPSSGRLTLCGDNPATSSDSRSFGTVARSEIIGKVVCLIRLQNRGNITQKRRKRTVPNTGGTHSGRKYLREFWR